MDRIAKITAGLGLGLLLMGARVGAAGDAPAPAADPPRLPDAAPTPVRTVDEWYSGGAAGDDEARTLGGEYSGFGAVASGGDGRPVFEVRSLADAGAGTLREALAAAAAAGGGAIVFAVAGDVVLERGLRVPANTTVDGLSAPAPGVTLWGGYDDPGGGVLEIYDGNVIVRGLRVRNAENDGVQIAPKHGAAIAAIVVDHCSITNSGDGGIDVTGRDGRTVRDVTLSWNYLAGNGGVCAKGTCGGGALVKYGVTRVSVHGNFWDKNLRRNPSIDGALIDGGGLADVRGNVVRQYAQSGVQVLNGARADVVGNWVEGAHAFFFRAAQVYAAENATPDGPVVAGNALAPWDVVAPIGPVAPAAVVERAGAPPRDAIDDLYVRVLTAYDEIKLVSVGPDVAPSFVAGARDGRRRPRVRRARRAASSAPRLLP